MTILGKYLIITPVRNEEKYIEYTIKSVLQQTVKPEEWIIVDDGSTDNTSSIIDEYSRKYDWIKTVIEATPNYEWNDFFGRFLKAIN